MVAKAAGAGRVIAVDISAHARSRLSGYFQLKHLRENALKNGATHSVDPTNGDAKEQIYKIIPGGPDVIIEAAGFVPVHER